jgi:anti-sigma factor ChrR (cupin superfamily)
MSDVPSRVFQASEVEWQTVRSGVLQKPLWSDPSTERSAGLMRLNPGAVIPTQRYIGDEIVYVVEGAIADEFGPVVSGNVSYRPSGCIHTVMSRNGATMLVIRTGKVTPVQESRNGSRSQTFKLNEIPALAPMPGVRVKPIWEDKKTSRSLALIRLDPETAPPRHRHVGDELGFGIEGGLSDEWCEVTPGNLSYRSDGCVHSLSTKNGATLLTLITGSVEPLE